MEVGCFGDWKVDWVRWVQTGPQNPNVLHWKGVFVYLCFAFLSNVYAEIDLKYEAASRPWAELQAKSTQCNFICPCQWRKGGPVVEALKWQLISAMGWIFKGGVPTSGAVFSKQFSSCSRT